MTDISKTNKLNFGRYALLCRILSWACIMHSLFKPSLRTEKIYLDGQLRHGGRDEGGTSTSYKNDYPTVPF